MEEKIKIEVTKDEALVLFEFLSRFNQLQNDKIFQDPSEQKILWTIEAVLEKHLTEPFMVNYKELIDEARNKVRDKE